MFDKNPEEQSQELSSYKWKPWKPGQESNTKKKPRAQKLSSRMTREWRIQSKNRLVCSTKSKKLRINNSLIRKITNSKMYHFLLETIHHQLSQQTDVMK